MGKLAGVLGVLVLLGGWATYAQWENRIAAEAVAADARERFEVEAARADSIEETRRRSDATLSAALDSIAEARQALSEAQAEVARMNQRAQDRVTSQGDSVAATLDSLLATVRIDVRPLVQAARSQHERERASMRALVTGLQEELRLEASQRVQADSVGVVWERRYAELSASFEARGRALTEARRALARSEEVDAGSWYDPILTVGSYVGAVSAGVLLGVAVAR